MIFVLSEETQTDVAVFQPSSGQPDENELRSSLNLPSDIALSVSNEAWPYQVKNIRYRITHSTKSELQAQLPPIKSDREGNTFVVAPLPGDLDLSSLSLLFLVAYSMGMLARYYPSKWLSLLSSHKGDFAFPLMKAAATLVEERFPTLVLQDLESSY
jgi:hypothetical protein